MQITTNALFYHTHTINGKVYSHAHPGCDGHSHNSADFTFYQQLQTILSEEKPKLLSEILPYYVNNEHVLYQQQFYSLFADSNSGRAPPVA